MMIRERPGFEDAELALRLYDLRREAEMRKARAMIGRVVAGAPWEDVEPLFDYEHPENAHLRQATSYWEMVASFVLRGILHPVVYADTCGEGLFTYCAFKPHLEKIRTMRPTFLAKTEEIIDDIPALRDRVAQIDAMMAARGEERARRAAAGAKGRRKAKRGPAKRARS